MPSSENTRKIFVDPTGRITALSDDLLSKSRPLKVGDRISFIGSQSNGMTERLNTGTALDNIQVCFREETKGIKFDLPLLKLAGLELPWHQNIQSESAASQARLATVIKHAIETFGSEEAAEEWMSIECGALDNESPANFIHKTGNLAEVDRILGCIDYGMIA